jgi:hypothetical protein
MRRLDQRALDRPDIAFPEPPVRTGQVVEPEHLVSGDPPRAVDVGIGVRTEQVAHRAEGGLPSVEAGVSRSRDRAPAAAPPVEQEHVPEAVLRVDVEDDRRVAVLLEDRGGGQHRLQAVRRSVTNHATERAQRALAVVGEIVEPALDEARSRQPVDEPELRREEAAPGRSPAHSDSASNSGRTAAQTA